MSEHESSLLDGVLVEEGPQKTPHPLESISNLSWPMNQIGLMQYILLSDKSISEQLQSFWIYASGNGMTHKDPSLEIQKNLVSMILSSIIFNNWIIDSASSCQSLLQLNTRQKNLPSIIESIKPEKNTVNPFSILLLARCEKATKNMTSKDDLSVNIQKANSNHPSSPATIKIKPK